MLLVQVLIYPYHNILLIIAYRNADMHIAVHDFTLPLPFSQRKIRRKHKTKQNLQCMKQSRIIYIHPSNVDSATKYKT